MKNIGMIVAVEMKAVIGKYGDSLETISVCGYNVKKYSTDEYNLFVLNCGAGQIAAAAGTQLLISEFKVDMIVNFGVVGGLTHEMSVEKTCIVESVVHYEFDTSPVDNCEVGRYMEYPSVYIPVTKDLVDIAYKLHPELKKVICASGDKFVAEASKKQELHDLYNADICEMEAAGIVLTCNRNKVPCLMIKTVSDGITGGANEFIERVNQSAEICLDIATHIIENYK